MPTDLRHTAVDDRLDRLREAFREAFPPERDGGCCLWVLDDDALPFLLSVVAVEASAHEAACMDDAFMLLDAGGAGSAAYAKTLGAEFAASMREQEGNLVERGVMAALWEHPPETRTLAEALGYVAFALAQLPDLEGRHVVYLAPETIADDGAYGRQVLEALATGLPRGIILMLATAPGSKLLAQLERRGDLDVTVLRPDLDLEGLTRQLVTEQARDADDDGARFHRLYVEVGESGAKSDFAGMRAAGAEAVAICEAGGSEWVHLAAAVHAAQGMHLLRSRAHAAEALERYGDAVGAARQAVALGHRDGHALLTTSLIGQGSALFYLERYGESGVVYAEAAELSPGADGTRAYELEARRMYAMGLQMRDQFRAAYEAHEHALSVGEALGAEICRHTALPYVGAELIALARGLGRHGEIPKIRARMEALLGPDWEDLIDPDAVVGMRS